MIFKRGFFCPALLLLLSALAFLNPIASDNIQGIFVLTQHILPLLYRVKIVLFIIIHLLTGTGTIIDETFDARKNSNDFVV